jgi:hypothetical protein
MTTKKTEGALPEFPCGTEGAYSYLVDWTSVREGEGDTPTFRIDGTLELEDDDGVCTKVGSVEAYWMPMAGWHCGGRAEFLVDHCDAFDNGLVRMAPAIAGILQTGHGWLAVTAMELRPSLRGNLVSWHLLGELLEMTSNGPVMVSLEAAPMSVAEGGDRIAAAKKLEDHWRRFGLIVPIDKKSGKPPVGWPEDPVLLWYDTDLQWPVGSFQRAVTADGVKEAIVLTAMRGLDEDGDIDLVALTEKTRETTTTLFQNGTLTKVVEEGESEK